MAAFDAGPRTAFEAVGWTAVHSSTKPRPGVPGSVTCSDEEMPPTFPKKKFTLKLRPALGVRMPPVASSTWVTAG